METMTETTEPNAAPRKRGRTRTPHAAAAAEKKIAVGMHVQFNDYVDDARGVVVFCEGGVVVIRQADGECESGYEDQIAKVWVPAPAPITGTGETVRRAEVAAQLQEGEPLPLLNFIERLGRLGCDVSSVRESEPPRIIVEGRILECEEPVLWRGLDMKIQDCEKLVFEILQSAISCRFAAEWSARKPAEAIFSA